MKGYCLNLARRADRWTFMGAQFRRLGLEVERFESVDGLKLPPETYLDKRPGGIACTLSHVQVIKEARRNNYPEVLIFEDDAVLCQDFNHRLELFLKTAPDDWQMLFLGMNDVRATPVCPHIYRIWEGWTTHAYIIRHSLYDVVIQTVGEEVRGEPDDYYNRLFRDYPCYLFLPCISYQRDDWSDIRLAFRRSELRFGDLYTETLAEAEGLTFGIKAPE